jgi:prepilin-type processing-associated H-X9-DG protein
MVFDGIVFGTRSHALRFQMAESESTNIVFIDGSVEFCSFGDWKTDSLAKFVDLVK